ncbi:unnamed protein product [Prorocentrum cordatum]|uniref:Uncharacterized protein n=1 Tax=Prorocentrum cordatum TaxID=2364126 RepID=A0ABN9PF84_9DINO|nr:unnamed protein product [Polarella glacialis]
MLTGLLVLLLWPLARAGRFLSSWLGVPVLFSPASAVPPLLTPWGRCWRCFFLLGLAFAATATTASALTITSHRWLGGVVGGQAEQEPVLGSLLPLAAGMARGAREPGLGGWPMRDAPCHRDRSGGSSAGTTAQRRLREAFGEFPNSNDGAEHSRLNELARHAPVAPQDKQASTGSSRNNWPSACGVTRLLGRRVAAQWLEAHPSARVVGATLGESSHAALRELGVEPTTAEALRSRRPRPAFPRVLFAAPPRRGQGVDPGAYAVAVAEAAEYVAVPPLGAAPVRRRELGRQDSGGAVREDSPVSAAPASQVLLGAERCALDAGGSVLRLAGLYDTDRGPHTYWLKVGKVSANPEGLINMLHYDDAAAAAVAALERGLRGEVLIVSDGSPLTRAEICRAAVGARPFRDEAVMPAFEASETGSPPPMGGKGNGKVLDASRAREVLRWSPRHASFASYMAAV